MRVGVRLGIDVGKVRVGIAKSDPHGMLATPVETIPRDPEHHADIRRIGEIISEYEVLECVIGLPLNLRGEHTPSTDDAVSFAHRVAGLGIPVRLIDERLSTVAAWGQLHQAGKSHKSGRNLVDQAAAVVILQQALDSERSRGEAVGELLHPESEDTH